MKTISDKSFLIAVEGEIDWARKHFPQPNMNFVALVEEVGELAEALLKGKTGSPLQKNTILQEAVQVAAMAMRVATEGDPSFEVYKK